MQVMEISCVGFLMQITGNQAKRQVDGTWETPAAEEVIRAAGMKLVADYIGQRQAIAVQWVDLRSLLEVCVRETGYEGAGQKQRF